MMFRAKSFDHLKGLRDFSNQVFVNHLIRLPGFSEQAVTTRLALYEGYVNDTNLLAAMMREQPKVGKCGTIEQAEMKRRFA